MFMVPLYFYPPVQCFISSSSSLFVLRGIIYMYFRSPAQVSLSLCGDLKRGKVDSGLQTLLIVVALN